VQGGQARVLPSELSAPVSRDFAWTAETGAAGTQWQLIVGLTEGRGQLAVRTLEVEVGELAAGVSLPEALREVSLVDLEHAPDNPEATAILHVEASDTKLRLRGFHVEAGEVMGDIVAPTTSLVDHEQGDRNPWAIFTEVRNFSRASSQSLKAWLRELMNLGREVALVIQEHVETRVPWEMVEVGDTPIGVKFTVVRWLQVEGEEGPIRLHTGRLQWTGRVLAYVDRKELPEAKQELAALADCVHDPCKDEHAFRDALDQAMASRALLFVASHGVMASPGRHAGAFGSRLAERRNVTTLDVEGASYLQGTRPLAFINACHSARLWAGKYGGLTGLPEVFLARVAAGYLGTLGEVEERAAALVGERILRAARTDAGVCVPRMLRELRQQAFDQVPKTGNKEGPYLSRYVNTSLYVFYGSPNAWLRLEPVTKGGAGG
jgi:hypothetical protein